MVDISEKKHETARTAHAASSVIVSKEVYEKMTKGEVKKKEMSYPSHKLLESWVQRKQQTSFQCAILSL
ncbi:hypothetical protein GCM10020331_030360 [Ectobacillus funiculus]